MTAHLQSLGSTAQALSVFCAEGAAVGFLGICTSSFLIAWLGALLHAASCSIDVGLHAYLSQNSSMQPHGWHSSILRKRWPMCTAGSMVYDLHCTSRVSCRRPAHWLAGHLAAGQLPVLCRAAIFGRQAWLTGAFTIGMTYHINSGAHEAVLCLVDAGIDKEMPDRRAALGAW
jgi:hypothetical protein